jgi:hypothetical protein
LGQSQFLTEDEANDIGHDLSQQIGTNADISTDTDTLRALIATVHERQTSDSVTDALPMVPIGATEKPTRAGHVRDAFVELQDKIRNTLDDKFLEDDPDHPGSFRIINAKLEASTGLTKETARRVNDAQQALQKIAALDSGWYHVGARRDVPKDACYVGHYRGCGGECYVWVCPDGRKSLAELTLNVLKLATVFQDTQVVTAPSGIQFSPSISRPSFR